MLRFIQFVLFSSLLGLSQPVHANPVDQALLSAIRRFALEYLDADLKSDADKMNRLLDDHFELLVPTRDGIRTFTKAQVLERMRTAPVKSPRIMAPDAFPIEVVGNIAIVKAVTRERVEVLTILMTGAFKKITTSHVQPRVAEFH